MNKLRSALDEYEHKLFEEFDNAKEEQMNKFI